MSQLPETKSAVLSEISAWEDIIHSPSWVVFRKLLDTHCDYLQKEANRHLEKHEDRLAGECLRAMKDAKKISELVRVRLEDLRKTADKQ